MTVRAEWTKHRLDLVDHYTKAEALDQRKRELDADIAAWRQEGARLRIETDRLAPKPYAEER